MSDYIEADRAREIVRNHYKSQSWKNKVDRMSDKQVYAIFFSICERVGKSHADGMKQGCQDIPKKVQKQKLPSAYGTPFLMSELQRLRDGKFGGVHG